MSTAILENLLEWVVPDREYCRIAAKELAEKNPGLSREELARRAVSSAQGWAASAGAATGVAANPLIALPAAVADMAAVLRIEGTMAGTVAALIDPDSLDNPNTFPADVLAIVFPGAVSQALRQLGVRWGQRITQEVIQKYLGEGLVKSVTKLASRYMFVHVTEKALVSKTVPLIGAGIGAGWNWLEVKAVGSRAIHYYQRKGIAPGGPGGPGRSTIGRVKSVASRVIRKGRRHLPGAAGEPGDTPIGEDDAAA